MSETHFKNTLSDNFRYIFLSETHFFIKDLNVCEMKFSLNEFTIDKDYDAILRNKMETFREESKTKKALQLTMITTYGVKRNLYSNRVQSEVLLDDLFV